MYRKIIKSAAVFLAVCLTAGVPAYADSELIPEDQISPETTEYETENAAAENFEVSTSASGLSEISTISWLVYSGKTAAYVEYLVNSGDDVKAGDPIMTISMESGSADCREQELKLVRMQDNYSSNSNLKLLEIQEMQKENAELTDAYDIQIGQLNVQKALMQYQQYVYEQEFAISQQQELVDEMKEELAKTSIYADSDGTIGNMTIFDDGETITDGTVICSITNADSPVFYLSNTSFRYGMQVELSMGGNEKGRKATGRVVLAGSAIPDSGFEGTVIAIDEESTDEMTALKRFLNTVTAESVTVSAADVLTVPNSAVEMSDGIDYVRILDADGILHTRRVNVFMRNRERSWITEGLNEGDRVVTD